MFAVIKTGGKQYKVQQGDVLQVEKLGLEKEKTITFEEVLLIEDGKKTLIGTPFVDKAKVRAVVIENFKDDKIIVFKKKRRKQYKKMRGHRQELSRVRIEDITVGGEAPKKSKPAEVKSAAAKIPAPKKTEAKKPEKKTAAPKPKTTKPKTAGLKPKTAPKKATTAKNAAVTKPVTKTKEK
jgi:large subunit ribosomal protein L21